MLCPLSAPPRTGSGLAREVELHTGEIHTRGLFWAPFADLMLSLDQSERLDLYRYHVQQLLDVRPTPSAIPFSAACPKLTLLSLVLSNLPQTNQAYRCFCTSTELAQIKEDLRKRGSPNTYDRTALRLTDEEVARKIKAGEKHVVRFKSSPGPIPFTDLVQGGTEAIPSAPMDDMVLLKSDGYPTYHLANVVDDHEMGITHVLRGEVSGLPDPSIASVQVQLG